MSDNEDLILDICDHAIEVARAVEGVNGRVVFGASNRTNAPDQAIANIIPRGDQIDEVEADVQDDDDDFGTYSRSSAGIHRHNAGFILEVLQKGASLRNVITLAARISKAFLESDWTDSEGRKLIHRIAMVERDFLETPQEKASQQYAIAGIAFAVTFATERGSPSRSAL